MWPWRPKCPDVVTAAEESDELAADSKLGDVSNVNRRKDAFVIRWEVDRVPELTAVAEPFDSRLSRATCNVVGVCIMAFNMESAAFWKHCSEGLSDEQCFGRRIPI